MCIELIKLINKAHARLGQARQAGGALGTEDPPEDLEASRRVLARCLVPFVNT